MFLPNEKNSVSQIKLGKCESEGGSVTLNASLEPVLVIEVMLILSL